MHERYIHILSHFILRYIKIIDILYIFFSLQQNDIADVIALDVDMSGRFIMTCNNKNELILWNLRGEILQKLDPRHGDTYSATLSPCGRFIATTGTVLCYNHRFIMPDRIE